MADDEIAVLVMFKNIDESRPEEIYSFNLVITDSGLYKGIIITIFIHSEY